MSKAEGERRTLAIIRSPDGGRTEILGAGDFWGVVGALQWMGTNRLFAFDVAKWVRHMEIGERQTLKNGVTIEITEDGGTEWI